MAQGSESDKSGQHIQHSHSMAKSGINGHMLEHPEADAPHRRATILNDPDPWPCLVSLRKMLLGSGGLKKVA